MVTTDIDEGGRGGKRKKKYFTASEKNILVLVLFFVLQNKIFLHITLKPAIRQIQTARNPQLSASHQATCAIAFSTGLSVRNTIDLWATI